MSKRFLKGAIVLSIAVVIASIVTFVLAAMEVLGVNPFKISFVILTLGIGLIFAIYGGVVKGGYELAVGLTLLIVGFIICLIGILKWYIILVITIGAIAIALLLLFLLKSDSLIVKRTDEEPGYRPYSEVMKDKKAQNAIDDSEPMPTLKDYSGTKKK